MYENIRAVRQMQDDNEETRDHYYKEIISFSHLLGMISSNVVEYIRSAFPENYFKTIWNSMEEPFVQRSKSFKDSMNKPRPALYMVPSFDPSEDSEFVPQSEFDEYISNHPLDQAKIGIWNSQKLIEYRNFMLYCKPRRYRMKFDLKFIFDTDTQRMQAQEYMRQSIRHRAPIQLHTYLENVIPTNYMKSIADMNGFDYKSDEFLTFINQLSNVPITRRLRTGSGNIEFFAMVKTPFDLRFPEPPNAEGPVTKGNITVNSSFSDYVNVEFVAYSVYFLVTNKQPGESIEYKDKTNTDNNDGSLDMVGIDKLFLTELPDIYYIENGCVMFTSVTIQAEKTGTDTLNLYDSGLISDVSIIEMINYYRDNNRDIDFIHPIVFEGVDRLDGARVKFNRNTLDLTISDMDTYVTYSIYLYLDKNKVNKEILDKFEPDKINSINNKPSINNIPKPDKNDESEVETDNININGGTSDNLEYNKYMLIDGGSSDKNLL